MHALKELLQAAGVVHPDDLKPRHIVKRISSSEIQLLSTVLNFLEPSDLLNGNYKYTVFENWWEKSQAKSFDLI